MQLAYKNNIYTFVSYKIPKVAHLYLVCSLLLYFMYLFGISNDLDYLPKPLRTILISVSNIYANM